MFTNIFNGNLNFPFFLFKHQEFKELSCFSTTNNWARSNTDDIETDLFYVLNTNANIPVRFRFRQVKNIHKTAQRYYNNIQQ
jgi:hypothetical protein